MTLFSVPTDLHSHRVRVVLFEKDIVVEIEDVNPNALPAEVLEVNPSETMPTLVDRELVLYDSRVICEYLDERFPHPPLMPIDPLSRAQARLALYHIENDWYPLAHQLETAGEKKRIRGLTYLAAMSHPTGGKNDVPNRLKRHFAVFNVPLPDTVSIEQIFGTITSLDVEEGGGLDVSACEVVLGKL